MLKEKQFNIIQTKSLTKGRYMDIMFHVKQKRPASHLPTIMSGMVTVLKFYVLNRM